MGLSYTLACLWLTLKDIPPRHIPSEYRQIFNEAKSNWAECCPRLQWQRGWSGQEWLWFSEEVLQRHWGKPALLHLSPKTGGQSPHKARMRWLGPKRRRGLLDGCVKLSNRAVGENSWGFTVSRMVHRSVISVKGPLLTCRNSLCMLRLEKFKSTLCCNTTPWFLSLKHPKQTEKKNTLRATDTMSVHSYTPQIQPN